MGDPYAYVQFRVEHIGNFIITLEITTASFNPNLNQKIQALFITVHAQDETKILNAKNVKNRGNEKYRHAHLSNYHDSFNSSREFFMGEKDRRYLSSILATKPKYKNKPL